MASIWSIVRLFSRRTEIKRYDELTDSLLASDLAPLSLERTAALRSVVCSLTGLQPTEFSRLSELELLPYLIQADAALATRKADTKTDKEKKEAPREVNDCARYIREQQKLIAAGKRLKADKKALISECLGHDDTARMERQLRRYRWLLDIGQAGK